ncbi:MAG: Gldg family protein, partial [Deltaproteobacteria bacterium]|nr:Gldg family protein [Deltaproteobacteria bacterium]
MSVILTIAKKDFWTNFSSPLAFVFLGSFLFVTLFIFFWIESFFARNIADIRPLFDYMPLLLIFLVAALTMKTWSEEKRSGTIEFLLTSPIKTTSLVLGKFFSNLSMVAIALLLTCFVPITVTFMGQLDPGPVIGAYIACLLLASAYISIGQYVSSKTNNQVISLIMTTIVCFVFYIVGSAVLTGFFGNTPSEILKLLGTGARFESIARGVLDLRDIYYYLSLTAVFLTLNTITLEKIKWSRKVKSTSHFQAVLLSTLLIANFILANFWLHQQNKLRIDLTRGNVYSVSGVTKNLLTQLKEPLLIRGYFSAKTHPLLAPLVPSIRDTIKEYAIAGNGNVNVEFIDPRDDEELETEANQKYGIRPLPFHFSDRHQAELVNSYFHILVKYGDKYEVLEFDDLIEVKSKSVSGGIDVKLRNLEYDLSKSVKKTLYGFQGIDHLFLSLKEPVEFVGYVSPDTLPESLAQFKNTLDKLLMSYAEQSNGKFSYKFLDPSTDKA